VEEDKVVHTAQDLESDGFLLLQQLNRLCVYIDFGWFLASWLVEKAQTTQRLVEKLSIWQSASAFGGQKLPEDQTNRPIARTMDFAN
jgi:hypothetical protein